MQRNLRLLLEYDGTAFKGWQVQPNQRTVQGELETCLASLLGHPLRIVAAGRTDAGVHALEQVANFRTDNPLAVERICAALNSLSPPDIAVHGVEEVPLVFNARRSAIKRTYLYRIVFRPHAIARNTAWFLHRKLNIEAMQDAANRLLGLHDFTSFCVAAAERENRLCHVFACNFTQANDEISFKITANRFLRSMVRSIVGTLVQVGRGSRTPNAIETILNARNRQYAGPSAPPQGLFLKKVSYEDQEG